MANKEEVLFIILIFKIVLPGVVQEIIKLYIPCTITIMWASRTYAPDEYVIIKHRSFIIYSIINIYLIHHF